MTIANRGMIMEKLFKLHIRRYGENFEETVWVKSFCSYREYVIYIDLDGECVQLHHSVCGSIRVDVY